MCSSKDLTSRKGSARLLCEFKKKMVVIPPTQYLKHVHIPNQFLLSCLSLTFFLFVSLWLCLIPAPPVTPVLAKVVISIWGIRNHAEVKWLHHIGRVSGQGWARAGDITDEIISKQNRGIFFSKCKENSGQSSEMGPVPSMYNALSLISSYYKKEKRCH